MSDHVWSDRPTAEVRDLSKQYTFFNWSPQATLQPRVIAGGSGATFWDTDGNRYLDFASDQIGTNAGHQHPRIVQAIVDALLPSLPALPFPTLPFPLPFPLPAPAKP